LVRRGAARDDLALDNPKFGRSLAQCGACTVHVDGEATRSCVTPDAVREALARARTT
jgi:aerobic-type carbon monoxide dehydrogenase small subunit (CoxS/CutS family)